MRCTDRCRYVRAECHRTLEPQHVQYRNCRNFGNPGRLHVSGRNRWQVAEWRSANGLRTDVPTVGRRSTRCTTHRHRSDRWLRQHQHDRYYSGGPGLLGGGSTSVHHRDNLEHRRDAADVGLVATADRQSEQLVRYRLLDTAVGIPQRSELDLLSAQANITG